VPTITATFSRESCSNEDDAHYIPHLPGCPNNGIHGIVTCAFCHDMQNKPTPAAPALSISQPKSRQITTALPARTNTWQRSYRPPATVPATGSTLSHPTSHDAGDVQVSNIVYQSLQRPKMLRGGEWQLSVVNNLVAAGFVVLTIITWNWRFLLGAMFFGWGVQWLIRVLGRHDPKWWRKYRRYSQQPAIREPHGHPEHLAPAPRILPKPSLFVH
jgi:type IV secretory pathway TrbD component